MQASRSLFQHSGIQWTETLVKTAERIGIGFGVMCLYQSWML